MVEVVMRLLYEKSVFLRLSTPSLARDFKKFAKPLSLGTQAQVRRRMKVNN